MNQTTECSECGRNMKQIGPFAELKPEGEPAKKWDGSLEYSCTNESCKNYGVVIRKT